MRKEQIAIVRNTWPEIELVADDAATIFYARLFAIAPETASLFAATDMRQQREKLMITLRAIVTQLDDLDTLGPQLDDLGRRHVAYGVRAEHYTMVGEALVWMLERILNPPPDKQTCVAWTEAFRLIAERMENASAPS